MRAVSFRWVTGGLILLAVGCAGAAYSQTVPPPGPPVAGERTIVVTGDGSVDATPDRATVALSVIVLRPTAQEAQQQSAATMAQVVRAIVAAGVPQTAIRTTTVSLYPQHRPDSGNKGPIT